MEEFEPKISVESRMEAYVGLVPDALFQEPPFDGVAKNSVLGRLLTILGLAWRSTGYVAASPSTMVRVCRDTLHSYASSKTPDAQVIAFGEKILQKVSRQIPELVETSSLRARLMEVLVTEADSFREIREKIQIDMPVEPMWQDFYGVKPFKMTAWVCQQISYVAFYNAYEAFLVDCMKCVLATTSLRVSDRDFLKRIREGLPGDVTGPCWGSQEVSIGREVRHSLSHGGGKPSTTLQGMNHGILIADGVLQIYPEDNQKLVAGLLKAVKVFVKVGVSNANLHAEDVP